MIEEVDSLLGVSINNARKKKPLLELAGNGAPQGQTRFIK